MASKATEHLRNIPLFSACTTKDLQLIAKVADEITLPSGHVLCDQGQTGREAFVIVDGSATVRRNGKKVASLGPGAIVGELSLLDHGPRTATVTTDSETTVLVLAASRFGAVMDEVPAVGRKVLASLAARIRDLDRAIYG